MNLKSPTIVEEKHPLKQGLKQTITDYQLSLDKRWRETSIKTRIETSAIDSPFHKRDIVEEKHPLKQGLKHDNTIEELETFYPLKRNIH